MQKKKVAIIGAGPAGIFTALFLKNFSGEVHLFEQNADIGEKLKRTGGGRMNVANKKYDDSCFFSSSEELKNIFFQKLSDYDVVSLLKEINLEYGWEKDRAILKSQNAKEEVTRLKKRLCVQENCYLRLATKILSIENVQDAYEVSTPFGKELFDILVIASGGMFRIGEDSNKSAIYSLLTDLGHNIISPKPSLSPLLLQEHLLKDISGVAIPMQFFTENIFPDANDGLITHFGFSGPVVLDFTAYWNGKDSVFINFLPHEEKSIFENTLQNPQFSKKQMLSFWASYLPKRLAEKFLFLANIPFTKRIAECSAKDWKKICELVFSYPLKNPSVLPYQGTWTTKGGVDLSEIKYSLESKKQKNCFLAGEVIDINGLCGGYHISFCLQCAKIIAEGIMKIK